MGFLEQRNPKATHGSVIAWSMGYAVVFVLLGLFCWYLSDMPSGAVWFILPWMAITGAVVGGATDWQCPK